MFELKDNWLQGEKKDILVVVSFHSDGQQKF